MGLEALGIALHHPMQGAYSGKLLIAGSGRCVWDDLKDFDYSDLDVMCLNDLIMHFPGEVKHAYSNDHHWLDRWVSARRPVYQRDYPQPIKHTCNVGNSTQQIWNVPGHGTSGLNACYVGIALGYTDIVLAGIPLDDSGHYFDPPWVKTNFTKEVPERDGQAKWWQNAAANVFEGRVKSLSGRSRELLGA